MGDMSYGAKLYLSKEDILSLLDKALQELETNYSFSAFPASYESVMNDIIMYEQLNYINQQKAYELRQRAVAAAENYRKEYKEHADIVDSYENPLERAKRFSSLEQYQAKISELQSDRVRSSSSQERADDEVLKR